MTSDASETVWYYFDLLDECDIDGSNDPKQGLPQTRLPGEVRGLGCGSVL